MVLTAYFQVIQQNIFIKILYGSGNIEIPKRFFFCGLDELSLAVSEYPSDVLLEQMELLE